MAAAFHWQFAVNALFHLTAWIMLGDNPPGAVIGAGAADPATVFLFVWRRHQCRTSAAELILATVTACSSPPAPSDSCSSSGTPNQDHREEDRRPRR
jgi:hypothetical protein